MSSSSIAEARNFRALDDALLTSGQPNEDQLEDAARQGVKVVINLALHDDPRYSLRDEAGSVRELGMEAFFAAMDAHKGEKTLVHCAANYRVTAFIGLYRVIREGWSPEKAFEPMRSV